MRVMPIFNPHFFTNAYVKNYLTWYIYIFVITLILRNITSQLQYISASAVGTSAITVTDE